MSLRALRSTGLLLLCALAACAAESTPAESDEDLTSLSARQRTLTFEGVVYVDPSASDAAVLSTVQEQTQSAFGALLRSNVGARSRDFKSIDRATFKRRPVTVVDASLPGASMPMTEVRYTYTDSAVVPTQMAQRTSLSLALLGQGHVERIDEVVAACTPNDKESKDDADIGDLWYDFDPSRTTCRTMMEREQQLIEDESKTLADPKTMVTLSRIDRVVLPVTMQLGRADTATHATYPEYDRLFAGAVERGVLTVVLIDGRLDHEHVEARKDAGYYEWLSTLDVVFGDHPDFALTKTEPAENLSSITAEGHLYDNLGFQDFIQWTVYGRGWPAGMPASSRDNIAATVANKLDNHWVTFEKKVKVSIGNAAPTDLTIRLETLFGVEEDTAPHRRALSRGDVVVYNGHSYIGRGPLDPGNYRAGSLTPGYQILWFDSCVSYNYYDKEFFGLKPNGSKDLELIVNGVEAPEYDSGAAEGRLLSKLVDGSTPSYQTLLESAKSTDALRVVEGEIDNRFDPKRTPIRFSAP